MTSVPALEAKAGGTQAMTARLLFNLIAILIGISLGSTLPGPVDADAQTLDELSFGKKLKLAKVGDEDAQIAVARAYEVGKQVKRSKLEAAKWYRMAMEQGNVEAQFRLARLVHQGGDGLKEDLVMAAQLYQGAAEQGNIEAQNWLGYSFQHGLGVQPNDQSAVEWYRKSADAGFPPAQNNLGLMYLTGKGVERSLLRAFENFQKAADQGDPWGLNNLGGMYEMGWGVEKDRDKAVELYKLSAEKGNATGDANAKRLSAVASAKPAEEGAASTTIEPAASGAAQ